MTHTAALLAALLLAAPASAGTLVLVAGEAADGKGKLAEPFGVDFAADGTLYLVEMSKGQRVRKVGPGGRLVTVAGTGEKGSGGDGGPGAKATFNGIHSLAVGADGRVYLADTWNNRVRAFDPRTGNVEAFAGIGTKGFKGDGGPAAGAEFGGVYSVAFDPDRKNLYLADLDNRRVRRVEMRTGTVTTVAGNGQKGVPKDGEPAVEQPLVDPRAAAADGQGNVYVLERGGHALRVVDKGGKIRTVAGTGKAGAEGTGGPALKAAMNGPKHLCIDPAGGVFVADAENHRVLRYDPAAGTLTVVAGTGRKGTAGVGGDPLAAELNRPHGVTVHPKTGELYITDSYNDRVLKITK